MRNIHILNPAAGMTKAKVNASEGIEIYETKGPHDVERFIQDVCKEDTNVHFTVYGGDGSLSEAVNGIMAAGEEAAKNVVLSVIPRGTGNDFVRNFSADNVYEGKVDLIKCNDRYCINMLNIGFDCDVVDETDKVKKFFLTRGSLGYIFGVIKVFFRKFGKSFEVEMTTKDGEKISKKGEFMLTTIANGQFCGGGFRSNPAADLFDGYFDAMVVNKLNRATFVRLIADYRKGGHIDTGNVLPTKKYEKLLTYAQCTEMKVKNITRLCIDGEMYYTNEINVSIVPSAINIKMPVEALF
ncbi:MAG: hypothetical protein IKL40_06570 [Clostridia bacterium]|nr:hypothetical protein [Clostridia bacterium]